MTLITKDIFLYCSFLTDYIDVGKAAQKNDFNAYKKGQKYKGFIQFPFFS